MTDAEIIKALECCIKDDYDKGCVECPVRCFKGCDFHLAKFTLDLIRRQQAEIEGLKSTEPTEEVRAKCEEVINKIRAEAIKEFADALKSKSEIVAPSVYAVPYRAVSVDDIDKFVKIAGGENDG